MTIKEAVKNGKYVQVAFKFPNNDGYYVMCKPEYPQKIKDDFIRRYGTLPITHYTNENDSLTKGLYGYCLLECKIPKTKNHNKKETK